MKSKQYPTKVNNLTVELLIESQKDYPSLWAAIQAIAPKFGCNHETLRTLKNEGLIDTLLSPDLNGYSSDFLYNNSSIKYLTIKPYTLLYKHL